MRKGLLAYTGIVIILTGIGYVAYALYLNRLRKQIDAHVTPLNEALQIIQQKSN